MNFAYCADEPKNEVTATPVRSRGLSAYGLLHPHHFHGKAQNDALRSFSHAVPTGLARRWRGGAGRVEEWHSTRLRPWESRRLGIVLTTQKLPRTLRPMPT